MDKVFLNFVVLIARHWTIVLLFSLQPVVVKKN